MAFPPRPPLLSASVVGQPYALTTAANLIPAACLPSVHQSLASIPTPIGARAPITHVIPSPPRPLHLSPRIPHLSLNIAGRPTINFHQRSNLSTVPPTGNAITRLPSFSQRIEASGPAVTVFVGNITEKAPDIMIRHILNSCGPVLSWKRVQGASGKLQGFGFCEFGGPDSALRAIRLLHDYDIAGSKLVVKADSKTVEILEDFKEKSKKANNGVDKGDSSPIQDEKKEEPNPLDYMDDTMRSEDELCLQQVKLILLEHRKNIDNYIPPQNKQDVRDLRMNKAQEKLVALSSGDIGNMPTSLNMDEIEDVEEGKREIISREIVLFREMMKKQEEERERDRKEREKVRERVSERSRERRRRSLSASSRRSRTRSPSVETIRHLRKDKLRSRTKSRSPSKKSSKSIPKDKEKEEEEKEKKEHDRKIRKKEMQYQERLRNWESREHKKNKELSREAERKKEKDMEKEREARKLREFLEDYDDERDDPKFYKGHFFQRKWSMREQEMEMDTKDRVKEKEELEELKAKIMAEGHENPDEAYEQAKLEREEQYKPDIVLKPLEKITLIEEVEVQPPSPEDVSAPDFQNVEITVEDNESPQSVGDLSPHHSPDDHSSINNDNSKSLDGVMSSEDNIVQPPKKKKFDVKDVFNQDDEDSPSKKKKLPLLGKERAKEKGGEEKRRHIKSLIDKIPTSKTELFAYPIDSSFVDSSLMEKRIRPWINKKIIEYIGEPEPSLVEFICSKVLNGSEPQSLLNDVQMVLDDEADVFVVKMWRLLIYEIEARKIGFGKT